MTARQVAARLLVALALATPGITLTSVPQVVRVTLLQSAAADDASSAETPVVGDVTDGDHGGGDAEKPPRSEENVDVPAEEPGTNPTTPTDPPVVDPPSEEPPAEDPTEPVPPVDDPDGEKPHDDDPAPIGPGNGGGPTIPPSNPGGPVLGPTDPGSPQGPSLPSASPVTDVFDALAWPLGSGVTTPRSRRVLGMTATSEPQKVKPATVQQLDEATRGSVSLNALRAEVLDAQYFRSRGAPRPTGPLRVAGASEGDLTLPLGLGVVGLGGGTVALAAIARRRRTWTGIEPTELDAMPAPRAAMPAPAAATDVWTPLVPRSPSNVPTNTMPVPR